VTLEPTPASAITNRVFEHLGVAFLGIVTAIVPLSRTLVWDLTVTGKPPVYFPIRRLAEVAGHPRREELINRALRPLSFTGTPDGLATTTLSCLVTPG
jgi:hypothetical protein